jgi:hypothetical protein
LLLITTAQPLDLSKLCRSQVPRCLCWGQCSILGEVTPTPPPFLSPPFPLLCVKSGKQALLPNCLPPLDNLHPQALSPVLPISVIHNVFPTFQHFLYFGHMVGARSFVHLSHHFVAHKVDLVSCGFWYTHHTLTAQEDPPPGDKRQTNERINDRIF